MRPIHLSLMETEAILDIIDEWEGVMGKKDLSVSEIGVNWIEHERLKNRMSQFIRSSSSSYLRTSPQYSQENRVE